MDRATPPNFKTRLIEELLEGFERRPVHVLDLGCGSARNFWDFLHSDPHIHYVGVELDRTRVQEAEHKIGSLPNVRLLHGFGEELQQELEGTFDLTISLSVLEHVKNLEKFLKASVRATRPGGRVAHRYDLGHALHPSSIRERLKVFLADRFPFLIPATRFTTHPERRVVCGILDSEGVVIEHIEYSQLPCLKSMINYLGEPRAANYVLAEQVMDLDRRLSKHMEEVLVHDEMEFWFPSVTVVGRRSEPNLPP